MEATPDLHVAIIPDGNRRWAKERHLPQFMGHQEGARTSERIIEHALTTPVNHLTLWACSIDNIRKRTAEEIEVLFAIFGTHLTKLLNNPTLERERIRVRVLGAWRDYFPASLIRIIEDLITKTAHFSGRSFNLLMAYSGVEEMLAAVRAIVTHAPTEPIIYTTIKQHLLTTDLPPVDLVIRTGGEPHLSSGFMMWDTADAFVHFSEKMWPDFSPQDFDEAITQFQSHERRKGK
jgi:undecaprenyl diphosphate synthase